MVHVELYFKPIEGVTSNTTSTLDNFSGHKAQISSRAIPPYDGRGERRVEINLGHEVTKFDIFNPKDPHCTKVYLPTISQYRGEKEATVMVNLPDATVFLAPNETLPSPNGILPDIIYQVS